MNINVGKPLQATVHKWTDTRSDSTCVQLSKMFTNIQYRALLSELQNMNYSAISDGSKNKAWLQYWHIDLRKLGSCFTAQFVGAGERDRTGRGPPGGT